MSNNLSLATMLAFTESLSISNQEVFEIKNTLDESIRYNPNSVVSRFSHLKTKSVIKNRGKNKLSKKARKINRKK